MTDTSTIRTRRRVVEADVLPPEAIAYMRENFDEGNMPVQDDRAMLLFMETHFSDRAYVEHRHQVLDRMFRAGKSVPEIAVIFDKSERTIWRWKDAMTAYFSESYSMQDVRDIHLNRVRDFDDLMSQCDEVRYADDATKEEKLSAARTKVRVHAMLDQVLRQAGYYRVFDVDKMRPEDQAGARDTEGFIDDLEAALLDEVPALEGPSEQED